MKVEALKSLIEKGSQILGGATGTAISLISADPTFASFLNVGITPLLISSFNKIGTDLLSRRLSERETAKIGTAYSFAVCRININIENRKVIRSDNFITEKDTNLNAEEIIEGVMLKVQKEYELKKLKFYGNFLGNISFYPDIDQHYANLLLKIIETLSYRQLCIIAYFHKAGTINLSKWQNHFENNSIIIGQNLYADMINLNNSNIIRRTPPYSLGALLGNSILSGIGNTIFKIMNLDEIDYQDINNVETEIKSLPN
ncbi:hypothetical protein [uncultured Bacteroides sp.]|uniref:hypothetical protein n=1 Tax=uncultured Bacteroides sp. TaxID=162156 RepID=UPI002AAA8371|nr:hypothetical protein [uncultured Bacteroides sp.]